MAGFYPDVPGPRMACDRDGTQWLRVGQDGVITGLSTAEGQALASFDPTKSVLATAGGLTSGLDVYLTALFPEPRDLNGIFISSLNATTGNSQSLGIWVSYDTTSGLDGNWTKITGHPWTTSSHNILWPVPAGRTTIFPLSLLGVRGVRVSKDPLGQTWTAKFTAIHFYGKASAVNDRLEFWHPTTDTPLGGAYFDWGDVPRNTTASRTFRIKNLSSTYTAQTARVAMETLWEVTPAVVAQHSMSIDGGVTWVSQVPLGDLAPGAISSVITFRRVTPSNALPGLQNIRLFAEATAWA